MTNDELRALEAEAEACQAEADAHRRQDEAVFRDHRVIGLIQCVRAVLDSRQRYGGDDLHQVECVDTGALLAMESAQGCFCIGNLPPLPRRGPYEHIEHWAEILTLPPADSVVDTAQGIAEALRRGSKHLPTASRFCFLEALAGELGRMAEAVREDFGPEPSE